VSAPLSPEVALLRLAQYGERTSTWSTATYNDGSEKALYEIALTLADRVAELEAERHSTNEALDDAVKALAEKNERIADLEESPLAWAEHLDLKSLDNLLISLSQATEYEPMSGVICEIHEVLAGFRTAADARAEQEFVAETGEPT
jgi:hypothetical protein